MQIVTDSGVVGHGQSGCWAYPQAVHEVVNVFAKYLVGQDPRKIEHHWHHLYRMGPFRGSILTSGVSAIDIALWDIAGKRLGVPIYELLGGPTRTKLRLHLLLRSGSIEELVADARSAIAEGFTALKFDPLPENVQSLSLPEIVSKTVACAKAIRDTVGESVDLIYIDPPFNSNRNYSGIIKGKNTSVLSDTSLKGGIGHNTAPFKGLRDSGGVSNSLILAQFEDTWRGGMKTYIHEFMFPIVKELHRILKPTGSFYLHCDPTAQAYLQVEVLDPIFGISNLRREIIWWRDNPSGGKAGANNYIHDHDIVFYYCKSQNFVFNRPFEDYSQEYIDQRFKFNDGDGKGLYRKQGVGLKIRKQYLSESKGKPLSSVWELSDINVMAKERTGYPTQKPEKLLERIILASSNEGDVVLDCFMGSGSSRIAADMDGYDFTGYELDKDYFDSSVKRFNEYKLQQKLL